MPKIIDFHIHPPGPGGMSAAEQASMAAYFRGDPPLAGAPRRVAKSWTPAPVGV